MVEDAGSAQQRTVAAERNDQIGAVNIRRAFESSIAGRQPMRLHSPGASAKARASGRSRPPLLVVIGNQKDLHSVAAFAQTRYLGLQLIVAPPGQTRAVAQRFHQWARHANIDRAAKKVKLPRVYGARRNTECTRRRVSNCGFCRAYMNAPASTASIMFAMLVNETSHTARSMAPA